MKKIGLPFNFKYLKKFEVSTRVIRKSCIKESLNSRDSLLKKFYKPISSLNEN